MGQDESFDDLAERIQRMQSVARELARKRDPAATLKRGFHAKGIGVRGKFRIKPELPEQLQVGLFQPDVEYDALVRFSNARSQVLGDLSKDQRGIAIRVKAIPAAALFSNDSANIQDFLMTNTPVSFARDPSQFIEVGEILLGGIGMVFPRLVKKYGFKEARRILGVFLAPLLSFTPYQMNTYWSRTSYQFGGQAARFLLRPAAGTKVSSVGQQMVDVLRSLVQESPRREAYLREKLRKTLHEFDFKFDFCLQLFVDDQKTPIEDAYIEWKETDSPPVPVAMLIVPKQELDDPLQQEMEAMAFSPWNTDGITPLGQINLARKAVYDASARHRGALVTTGKD